MKKHEKVHPHRGHKVHPAHTVKGVSHHSKMDHNPSPNAGGGYQTQEPMGPGISEVPSPMVGSMSGGAPSPMDADDGQGGM